MLQFYVVKVDIGQLKQEVLVLMRFQELYGVKLNTCVTFEY